MPLVPARRQDSDDVAAAVGARLAGLEGIVDKDARAAECRQRRDEILWVLMQLQRVLGETAADVAAAKVLAEKTAHDDQAFRNIRGALAAYAHRLQWAADMETGLRHGVATVAAWEVEAHDVQHSMLVLCFGGCREQIDDLQKRILSLEATLLQRAVVDASRVSCPAGHRLVRGAELAATTVARCGDCLGSVPRGDLRFVCHGCAYTKCQGCAVAEVDEAGERPGSRRTARPEGSAEDEAEGVAGLATEGLSLLLGAMSSVAPHCGMLPCAVSGFAFPMPPLYP